MKNRVIPNAVRDLSRGHGLHKLRRVIRASWVRSLALLGMTACVIWFALPKPPLLEGMSFSQCVRDRNGKLLRVTLSADQKFRIWTPMREISPALIDATLRFEDKYYRHHPGVNPVALLRSALNLRPGHAHNGASTITMQLARLRYHLRTRALSGKLVQILRALELERHYSKAEILEAYLNLAPYGRNIEGVGAASQIYFGKTAAHLTRPESISLSVIPQSPTRRALLVDLDNGSLDSAQSNWYDRAKIDRQFSARLFSARARSERRFLAPHFVHQVLATEKGRDEIVTTLDLAKQQLIERRIGDYIRTNRGRGIQNAAALLVDTRNMNVLAQVGSADFFNADIQGQVDGTRSPRSPGSTLKPFVYALALEQGLIHPLSILSDAPHSFADYNPENFDREFAGPIRASDALARSRNLPAVELAAQLRHPTLYEFLRGAGVKLPRSESLYGLALPLGGAEITMEDLVRLYAALANNGELRSLRRTSREPIAARGRSIIMPEAAFLTLEMLNLPRPEMGRAYSDHAAPVFWKTGTSHGFHDAWSIAVFNHYVLADALSGLRVARDDGTRQLRREVYEFWPTELLSIFRRAGVPRKLPPPFLPGTTAEFVARSGNAPRIVSPPDGQKILPASAGAIPLQAKADADVREIYWFAGKTFIGRAPPQEVISWKASAGRCELIALDDHGRSVSSAITVQ